MLSYKLQWRIRRKRGSGESRMDISVGERACVGITLPESPRLASRAMSLTSIGLRRRTSSRKIARMRSPRSPFQPEDPPAVESGLRPTPWSVRP